MRQLSAMFGASLKMTFLGVAAACLIAATAAAGAERRVALVIG